MPLNNILNRLLYGKHSDGAERWKIWPVTSLTFSKHAAAMCGMLNYCLLFHPSATQLLSELHTEWNSFQIQLIQMPWIPNSKIPLNPIKWTTPSKTLKNKRFSTLKLLSQLEFMDANWYTNMKYFKYKNAKCWPWLRKRERDTHSILTRK